MSVLCRAMVGLALLSACGGELSAPRAAANGSGEDDSPSYAVASAVPTAPTTGTALSAVPRSGVCAIKPGQQTCTVELHWTMPSHSAGCLYLQGKNQLFTCAGAGQAGSKAVPWVGAAGATFELRLGSNPSANVIATIGLKGAPIDLGAIRFDAWSAQSDVPEINNLEQVGYKFFGRMPFYTQLGADHGFRVASDRQDVADREIDLAVSRGITYFAFDYARFTTRDFHTGQLPPRADAIQNRYLRFNFKASYSLDLYLASPRAAKPKFTLLIGLDLMSAYLNAWRPASVSRDTAWRHVLDDLRPYLSHPLHHKTPDGRPILYLLGTAWLEMWDNDIALARAKLSELRNLVPGQRLFIVMLSGYPDRLQKAVGQLGVDSTSTYAHHAGFVSGGRGVEEPYSKVAVSADWFRNTLAGPAAAQPVDTIPNVTVGWDYRPLMFYGGATRSVEGSWYRPATPQEVVSELDRAVDFVVTHPDRVWTKNVLLYAWNELEEGGLLVPTLAAGSRLLDAIARYRGIDPSKTGVPSVPAVTRPTVTQSGAGCADGYGVWLNGYNFGSRSVIQLRNAGGQGPAADRVIETITTPSRGSLANGHQSLSFCLQNATSRSHFAAAGLDVTVVNPDNSAVSLPIRVKLSRRLGHEPE